VWQAYQVLAVGLGLGIQPDQRYCLLQGRGLALALALVPLALAQQAQVQRRAELL
jgi:hypothetical protein